VKNLASASATANRPVTVQLALKSAAQKHGVSFHRSRQWNRQVRPRGRFIEKRYRDTVELLVLCYGGHVFIRSIRSQSDTKSLPMPAANSEPARLLFVLDNDFGELTTVMYLLKGQSLFERSTVLLPERIYVPNKDRLKLPAQQYKHLNDILAVCDREDPNIVFLCAGYLFSTHGTLTLDALEKLVNELNRRGCAVVTCDPFMGMIGQSDFDQLVDIPIPVPDAGEDVWVLQMLKQSEQQRLVHNLKTSHDILKDYPHLYPVPYSAPGVATDSGGIHAISFYNPCLVVAVTGSAAADSSDQPYWFFVLAQCDFEHQTIDLGLDEFLLSLWNRFAEADRAGRRVVFVAPKDCIGNMEARLPPCKNTEMISFCDYDRFTSLLLGAEFAFYWNAVSHSILLRLLNAKPVFLFNKGHLARGVKTIYTRIIDCYYQGREPIYLDPLAPLALPELSQLSARYREQSKQISEDLQKSPTPEEVIDEISQLAGT